MTKQISLQGTVEKWVWANPHSWLYIRVVKADGSQEVWGFEAGSTGMLARSGWNAADMKPGDKVTVNGSPERSGNHIGLLNEVQLANRPSAESRGRVRLPRGWCTSSRSGRASSSGRPPGGRMPRPPASCRGRSMIKHKTLLAVALCSAMLALPAGAAEPLGSSWADVTKLPDFFTGNWQSMTSFLDNPVQCPVYCSSTGLHRPLQAHSGHTFCGPRLQNPWDADYSAPGLPAEVLLSAGHDCDLYRKQQHDALHQTQWEAFRAPKPDLPGRVGWAFRGEYAGGGQCRLR